MPVRNFRAGIPEDSPDADGQIQFHVEVFQRSPCQLAVSRIRRIHDRRYGLMVLYLEASRNIDRLSIDQHQLYFHDVSLYFHLPRNNPFDKMDRRSPDFNRLILYHQITPAPLFPEYYIPQTPVSLRVSVLNMIQPLCPSVPLC